MIDTTTTEGQGKRIQEIVSEHLNKSKHPGDYHERVAQGWTGISNRELTSGIEHGEYFN